MGHYMLRFTNRICSKSFEQIGDTSLSKSLRTGPTATTNNSKKNNNKGNIDVMSFHFVLLCDGKITIVTIRRTLATRTAATTTEANTNNCFSEAIHGRW